MVGFSYVAEPIKYLVVIPFINLGAYVFGTEHTLLSYDAIKASYDASFWQTAKDLSFELLCGTVSWALTAIPIGILVYFILKSLFTFFAKLKTNRLSNEIQ